MTLEASIERLVAEAVRSALEEQLPPILAGFSLPPDPEKGYSVTAAAEYLGVTRSCIQERIKAGELEAIRLGKYVVIPHRSIQALVSRELAKARANQLPTPTSYDLDGIDDDISQALGLSPAPARRAGKRQERPSTALRGS